jgi:hypothetical protein
MKIILTVLSMILIFNAVSCQVPNDLKKTSFQYVVLPDSVSAQIRKFYREKESRDSIAGQVTIFNIKYPSDFQFKEGLFRFKISGPHFVQYYFVHKKGKIHIFYEKDALTVIKELEEFIRTLNITQLEKIELIELTALMLREEYEIENN